MGNDIIQFLCEEDGCIYFYDTQKGLWRKICDIQSPSDIPLSVRKKVREEQDRADIVRKIPL